MVRVPALENYARIVKGILGEEFFRLGRGRRIPNPVTGALNDVQYDVFSKNFVARLHRLHNIYPDGRSLQQLSKIVNRVGTANIWQGAFAELAALDFFNFPLHGYVEIPWRPVEIDLEFSTSQLLGQSDGTRSGTVSIDGTFPEYNVHYDTKTMKDNIAEILQGVYRRVCARFAEKRIMIAHEFEPDSDWYDLSNNVMEIEQELADAIHSQPGIKYVRSRVVKGLEHRLKWGGGIIVTGSAYSPYRHAQQFYHNVFKDYHQFVIDKPFLLVYVVFPWYNGIGTNFSSMNRDFYRAVSRRAFCEHTRNQTPLSVLLKDKSIGDSLTNVTISQASKSLSGIFFLEDKSIRAVDSDKSNVSAYLYVNPNANQKLKRSLFRDFVQCELRVPIDDFEYDNY